MRRWLAILLLVLGGCVLTGCMQELDDAVQRVDDKAFEVWKATKAALDAGITNHTATEESRAVLEATDVKRRLKEYLDSHTSEDGEKRLVSKQGDKVVPLLRADLEQMILDRDTLLLTAALNHKRNLAAIEATREAIAKFDMAMEIWIDAKTDITTKRKSMAAAGNAALNALISAATSAGIMLPLIIP